jgi:transcriptional regulator with XRE-family HTH domain
MFDETGNALTMTLSERIAHARKAQGLTQAELGRRVGLSQSAIGSYESESGNEPSIPVLIRIAKETGFTPCWLAFEHGPERVLEHAHNGAPPHPPLNRELIGQIIVRVERLLHEGRLDLLPEKKARMILALYDIIETLPIQDENALAKEIEMLVGRVVR